MNVRLSFQRAQCERGVVGDPEPQSATASYQHILTPWRKSTFLPHPPHILLPTPLSLPVSLASLYSFLGFNTDSVVSKGLLSVSLCCNCSASGGGERGRTGKRERKKRDEERERERGRERI